MNSSKTLRDMALLGWLLISYHHLMCTSSWGPSELVPPIPPLRESTHQSFGCRLTHRTTRHTVTDSCTCKFSQQQLEQTRCDSFHSTRPTSTWSTKFAGEWRNTQAHHQLSSTGWEDTYKSCKNTHTLTCKCKRYCLDLGLPNKLT